MQLSSGPSRRRYRRLSAVFATILASLALTTADSPAHADRSSGTWTGDFQLRGNYYWETSTRVVAPSVGGSLESPGGVRLHADYLVDSITSASQAAGTIVDVGFTEIRHEFGLGGGYEFELPSGNNLEVDLSTRFSREPDYRSYGVSLSAGLFLNQRNTVLRFGLNVVRDSVRQVLRGANRTDGMGGDLSDRGELGVLRAFVPTVAWEQNLSSWAYIRLGYDYGLMDGFLANAYRMVSVDGVLRPETHPGSRNRHTLHGRLAIYVRPTRTAFHLLMRGYVDDWEIRSITPELRIYQELGSFVMLRLRHRHYRQTAAFFAQDQYAADDMHFTADPKMTRFHSNLLGVQLRVELGFLEDTALSFLQEAALDFGFEYLWNTNRFGDGVISQAGLYIPF